MSGKTVFKPKALNKKIIDGGSYLIHEQLHDGKTGTRQVEADEIAYDVIGMRRVDKTVVLDHIKSGWKIGTFRTETKARAAIRDLMQVTDFKWIQPPAEIKLAVTEILRRYA